MNRKIVGVILILAGLGLIGYWAAAGASLWGQEQKEVEVVDEMFGTVSKEWVDDPRPALLPVIGPAAGVLLLLGGGLIVSARKKPTVV